jgi:DNA repair exonuclease SbcCD nuclease subunit
MKRSHTIFIGALAIIVVAIAHTSMVMYDAMSETALKDIVWIRIMLAVLVSSAIEGAVLVYIREGKKLPSIINAIFSVVFYLCAVQPFGFLDAETYLSIGKTVFGFSIGINMWFYSELYAKHNNEESENKSRVDELENEIKELNKKQVILIDSNNSIADDYEQMEEQLERSVSEHKQDVLNFEQAELQSEQALAEAEQRNQTTQKQLNAVTKKLNDLEQATTCVCGYKAELKHHQAKCEIFQNENRTEN